MTENGNKNLYRLLKVNGTYLRSNQLAITILPTNSIHKLKENLVIPRDKEEFLKLVKLLSPKVKR